MDDFLQLNIKRLKGVGLKTELKLNKMGINTIGDIVSFYPRAYEDYSAPQKIEKVYLSGGTGCIKVSVVSGIKKFVTVNKKKIFKIKGFDGEKYIEIVFFNNFYAALNLAKKNDILILGQVKKNKNGYEIFSPKVCEDLKICPVYPQNKDINTKKIENLVKTALDLLAGKVEETLPDKIIKKYNLCSLDFAIRNIHFPEDKNSLERAKKRLIFEEILIWQIAMAKLKNYLRQKTSIKLKRDFTEEFLFLLPFIPTKAQLKALKECTQDMLSEDNLAMSRLIQGDVGSGKTVVAAGAAYNAAKNGYQTAIMVPTEILAVQHYNTFIEIFKGMDINIGLLSGKLKITERKRVENGVKTGEIQIIIGTSALISEKLEFAKLGLVITDEQHRFGVRQRMKLTQKGENPHTLIMSATPIPRTLSMVIYGDLDISVLDELPPGRKEIKTFCINSKKRERAFNFLKESVNSGGQGYIVCPLIEEKAEEKIEEETEVRNNKKNLEEDGGNNKKIVSIETYKNYFLKKYFSEHQNEGTKNKYKIEILHGKMNSLEKDEIMERFIKGETQILISTTVIEVGVNVPNACIIIIENAERFGISQLHQLRGRVGRGEKDSYCILIASIEAAETFKRLKAMCSTNDGFYLAEEDLKIRGPGEIFGNKQHGMLGIKLAAALKDINIIEDTKKAMHEILLRSELDGKEFEKIKHKVQKIINKTGTRIVM